MTLCLIFLKNDASKSSSYTKSRVLGTKYFGQARSWFTSILFFNRKALTDVEWPRFDQTFELNDKTDVG